MLSFLTFANVNFGISAGELFTKNNDELDSIYSAHSIIKNDSVVARASIGYSYNDYVGLEVSGLVDFANFKYNSYKTVSFNEVVLDQLIVLSMPAKYITFNAKFGAAELLYLNVENKEVVNDFLDDKIVAVLGTGVGYKITKSIQVKIEDQYYVPRGVFKGMNYVGVGLQYTV
jgi:hypothetical protein